MPLDPYTRTPLSQEEYDRMYAKNPAWRKAKKAETTHNDPACKRAGEILQDTGKLVGKLMQNVAPSFVEVGNALANGEPLEADDLEDLIDDLDGVVKQLRLQQR